MDLILVSIIVLMAGIFSIKNLINTFKKGENCHGSTSCTCAYKKKYNSVFPMVKR